MAIQMFFIYSYLFLEFSFSSNADRSWLVYFYIIQFFYTAMLSIKQFKLLLIEVGTVILTLRGRVSFQFS